MPPSPLARTTFVFVAVVLVFEVLWAFLSASGGLDYFALRWASLPLYAGAGFMAARYGRLRDGALAGSAVAVVQGTLGWALAAAVGPGRVAGLSVWALSFVLPLAVLFFAVMGGLAGLWGCGLQLLLARRRLAAEEEWPGAQPIGEPEWGAVEESYLEGLEALSQAERELVLTQLGHLRKT